MRRATKTCTQRISAAQFRAVGMVAALTFSCFLPYAVDSGLGYPNVSQNEAHASTFEPSASPIASRALNVMAQTATFNTAPRSSIEYLFFPRDLTAAIQPDSFKTSATVRTIGSPDRETYSHAIQSPSRIAPSYGRSPIEAELVRINFGTATLAPMAFIRFCMKYPQECEIRRMAFRPRPVVLTAARKAELVVINRDVNRAIRPRANNDGVMQEEWLVSPREGDCNDYAVTKRHELLARGWPSRSLLLSEVVIPSGEHHLVLIVHTREGDFVLDNLNANVQPVSQVPYQWVRAQQQKNPRFWTAINVTRAARVAMSAR